MNDGKNVYITALDNFEEFNKELLKLASKNAIVKEKHEHLDYDHPLFYVFLELLTGGAGILTIKLISQLNQQYLIILFFLFLIYLIILGAYLLISKPVAKRLG